MQYLRFFIFKDPFQKDDEPQKLFFCKTLPFSLWKINCHYNCGSVWFEPVVLCLCLRVVFPFGKHFFNDILFKLVKKTKQVYGLTKIRKLYIYNKFSLMDVQMCTWYDIFAFVLNLLGFDWSPTQVTIGFFQATKIIGQALANHDKHYLINMDWG